MCRIRPRKVIRLLRKIERKVDAYMSANQERLDALDARLGTVAADIRGDIQALKDQVAAGEALDFGPIEARVGGLEGLAAENPAPVEPPA